MTNSDQDDTEQQSYGRHGAGAREQQAAGRHGRAEAGSAPSHGHGAPYSQAPDQGYGAPYSQAADQGYGAPYGPQAYGQYPQQYGQPDHGPAPSGHRAPPAAPQKGNGLATAGFVVGLIGFLLSLIPFVGVVAWPLVIIGLVLSGVGLVRAGRRGGRGLAIAGVVLSALGLVVCIIYASAFNDAMNQLSPTPAPGAAAPATGPSAAPAQTAALGSPVTFGNGLVVTVGPPAPFTPSSTAAGAEGGAKAFTLTVTVRNGSQEVFQPPTTTISASVDGQEAQAVFDSSKKILGPPTTSVQPGKSTTYKIAFSSPVPSGDLQVDVRPGFVLDPATFTGRL